MNRTENVHPVEVLLLVALLALEAAITIARAVLVHAVALLLTVTQKPSTAPAEPAAEPAEPAAEPAAAPAAPEPVVPVLPHPPLVHPLQTIATDLQALSCKQLMILAGTRRKLPKQQLIGMVAACS
jgi:hypothetical protein